MVPKFLNRLLALKLLEQKVCHAQALPAAHRKQPCCSTCSVTAAALLSSCSPSVAFSFRCLCWAAGAAGLDAACPLASFPVF